MNLKVCNGEGKSKQNPESPWHLHMKKNTSKPPHFALFWNLTTPDLEQSSSRAFNALKLLLNNVYTTGKSQL
uniref:Uncharacterized protein n=1 Tax=Populus trichocarpa TaxID=3694 RepID=A0A2K1ZKH6_POPTR